MNKKTICVIFWIISIIILLGAAYFLKNLLTHYKLTYMLFIITIAIVILITNWIIYKSTENNLIPNFKIIIGFVAIIICLVLLVIFLNYTSKYNYYYLNPVNPSKLLLQTQINNPGTLTYAGPLKFSNKYTLSSEALSENTGISPDQVKFVTDLNNFETNSENNILKYIKSTKGIYKIGIICDYFDDNTTNKLSNTYGTEIPNISNISWEDVGTYNTCILFPQKVEDMSSIIAMKGKIFCWGLGIIIFGLLIFVSRVYYNKTKKIDATIGFIILSITILLLLMSTIPLIFWRI